MFRLRDREMAEMILGRIAMMNLQLTLMNVCGTHQDTFVRFGLLDRLSQVGIDVRQGPGCPVCVTLPQEIDEVLALAKAGKVITVFGDAVKVPGTKSSLQRVKGEGADVRIVYGIDDAVGIAKKERDKEVVFFAIGFETTAPANAMAVLQAQRQGLTNFTVLVYHVLVPPAIEAILSSPSCRVQGFLAAGHVCTVMGTSEYGPLVERYHVPIVVTGFEPLDVLEGIRRVVLQLEQGRAEVENAYARAVRDEGNPAALAVLDQVFEPTDRAWRGIGSIPRSGWRLREPYAAFDAELRFDVGEIQTRESELCRSGEVLQGLIKPFECAAFGRECTPQTPLGATMVSGEGACAAYYRYRGLAAAGVARD